MSYKPNDSIAELFVVTSTTGAAADADSLPSAALVRNAVDDGTVTLTVAKIDTGRYKVTGTVPNTYASGDKLQIYVSATVGGVATKAILPMGVLDSQRLSDGVNVTKWTGNSVAATNVNGVPLVDVAYVTGAAASTQSGAINANITQWSGTNVATPDTAGYPKVTLKSGTGAGEVSLTSGAVTAGTVSDKTGYTVSGTVNANITQWSGTNVAATDTAGYPKVTIKSGTGAGEVSLTSGAVTAGTVSDKTGYTVSGTVNANITQWSGTNVAATDTAGYPKVTLKSGTGAGEVSLTSGAVTAGTVSDKTGYSLAGTVAANVTQWNGSAVATPDTAGFPKVTIKSGTGTGEVSLTSGAVTAGTVSDKTGYSVSGTVSANVTQWSGTNVAATDTAGYPKVTLKSGAGTGEISLSGGAVTAGTVSDKTGYSIAGTVAANVTQWSGSNVATPDAAGHPKVTLKSGVGAGEVLLTSGAVTAGTVNDKTGYGVTGTVTANVTQWSGSNVATPDAAGHPKVTLKSGTGAGEVSLTSGAVTAGTVGDKSGYVLASNGLDPITISNAANVFDGETLPAAIVAIFRRVFKKVSVDADTLSMYADNGSTVLATQSLSDDGVTQTLGAVTR